MNRATDEIISIKCGTNKANHKHEKTTTTKRSGKFIITVKHFRALEMRCKCCSYTVYILNLCFYFHLAERQNLDDCFFLSFSHALSFRLHKVYRKKDKLGRYFTRIWTRTKQRNTHTNGESKRRFTSYSLYTTENITRSYLNKRIKERKKQRQQMSKRSDFAYFSHT